jgi:hypothetical protein
MRKKEWEKKIKKKKKQLLPLEAYVTNQNANRGA